MISPKVRIRLITGLIGLSLFFTASSYIPGVSAADLAAGRPAVSDAAPARPARQVMAKVNAVPNEVLVKVESRKAAEAIATEHGATVKEYHKHGYAVLVFPQDVLPPDAAFVSDTVTENSTSFYPNVIYTLDETGPASEGLYASDDWLIGEQAQHVLVNAYEAWTITQGSPNVLVAVIDNGIDIDHPDFTGRISPLSYNTRTDQTGIQYVAAVADAIHGTHVAGIIAAAKDNGHGGCGIAPGVQLLIVKATDDDTMFSSDIIEGIYYAVDHGADIINISAGASWDPGDNPPERVAIQYAMKHGVIVVCSAGNKAESTPHYPAAFPESVAVSAADSRGQFATAYSNYGSYIDICAPGTSVLSTIPNDSYRILNGTSMAAPVVAGVAALIKSLHPEYSAEQLIYHLCDYAIDKGEPGFDAYYGYGLVNAYAALVQDQGSIDAFGPNFTGTGSLADPYLIGTADQLIAARSLINMGYAGFASANYRLTADIDLSDYAAWTPIGMVYVIDAEPYFTGVFDGNGYAIRGMCISVPAYYQAVNQAFGFIAINRGKIMNLELADAAVLVDGFPSAYTGGVAGINSAGGTIIGCSISGFVTSSGQNTGGIAGSNRGNISKCVNRATVRGGTQTGGIAGKSTTTNISIIDCANLGTVQGDLDSCGGIVGYNNSTIRLCRNSGIVSGDAQKIGGIAGYNQYQIQTSYSNGFLSGSSECIGGVVGYNANYSIRNCYNTGSLDGQGQYAGGIAGIFTGSLIQNCYNTGLISGSAASSGGIAGLLGSVSTISQCYFLDQMERGTGTGIDSAVRCAESLLYAESTFAGFDFAAVWQMPDSPGCSPVLTGNCTELVGFELTDDILLVGSLKKLVVWLPDEATITDMVWTYDPAILTIDKNGFALGVSPGSTIVSATSKQGGFSAQCSITVRQGVSRIALPEVMTIAAGDTYLLQPDISPADCHDRRLVWSSSNPLAIQVDLDGTVRAIATGVSRITATAADGSSISASCLITVVQPVTGISLNPPETRVSTDNKLRLFADVMPLGASNLDVVWSSSNPDLATVDSLGVVTGIATGWVTITATTIDGGYTASCQIQVVVPVEVVIINHQYLQAAVGDQVQLSASVLPATAGIKDIIWQAYDSTYQEKILTVDSNGMVTCLREGEGNVIAMSKDTGVYGVCTITVGRGQGRITINGPDAIGCGQQATYTTAYMPYDDIGQVCSLSIINDTNLATLSNDGTLSALKAGFVQIYAEATDPYGAVIFGLKVTEVKYVVQFQSNGGSKVSDMLVSDSTLLTGPPAPVRTGYTFSGWFRDTGLTVPWSFTSDVVTANMTLYAQWGASKITSNTLSINDTDGLIGPLSEGTTIHQLLLQLDNSASQLQIKDLAGNIISDYTRVLATGMTIVIKNAPASQLSISIKGDLNGDGAVSALDLLQMKKYLLGQISLNGSHFKAALVTGNKDPSALDLLQIKKHLLGQITIK